MYLLERHVDKLWYSHGVQPEFRGPSNAILKDV